MSHQKWEYQYNYLPTDPSEFMRTVNTLGSEGWELVGQAGSCLPSNLYIFKRPELSLE